MTRVADLIVRFLESRGLTHVFTVSGGGSIFLCDALAQAKSLKYVACHHEQAAAMATEGYARARQGLGVTLVTTGPGGTNAITGIAGSWMDSVPHLVISGQVFSSQTIRGRPGLRQYGVQEINIIDLVRPITKLAQMIEDPLETKYWLEKAIHVAQTGRPGPVWLDVPANIQNARIEESSLRAFDPTELAPIVPKAASLELASKVRLLIDWIRSSSRPLVHLGQGIQIARATERWIEFLSRVGIPFVTARNANELVPWDHPLLVGRPGTFAQRGANFAVQTCDLLLAVGTRLTLPQTGYDSQDYARNARIAWVDVDAAELAKGAIRAELKIHSDAKDFLDELERQWTSIASEKPDWSPWRESCRQWKSRYPVVLPEYACQTQGVNSYYLVELLSDILGPKDIVVTDMGFAFQNVHQAFRNQAGQRMFTNCGFASMGWGLPAAIGASFASPGRRVVCVAGEGGFLMTSHELATVMHHRLPIKLMILNNGGYLTIKQSQQTGFEGRLMGCSEESGISFPDLRKLADAHRIPSSRLDSHADLRAKLESALEGPGPALIEILMDPDQIQAPMSVNRRNPDGTLRLSKFEDLYPYLEPGELEENMAIATHHQPKEKAR